MFRKIIKRNVKKVDRVRKHIIHKPSNGEIKKISEVYMSEKPNNMHEEDDIIMKDSEELPILETIIPPTTDDQNNDDNQLASSVGVLDNDNGQEWINPMNSIIQNSTMALQSMGMAHQLYVATQMALTPPPSPPPLEKEKTLFEFLVEKVQKFKASNEIQRNEYFLRELHDLIEQLQIRSPRLILQANGEHHLCSHIARLFNVAEGEYLMDLNALATEFAYPPEPTEEEEPNSDMTRDNDI